MLSPTGRAVFQGDGEKQVIYLRLEQQEKFPNTAQVKGRRAPDRSTNQAKQRLLFLRVTCCIVNVGCKTPPAFSTASQLSTEEIILTLVTNWPELHFSPRLTWMENGKLTAPKGELRGLGPQGGVVDRIWYSRLGRKRTAQHMVVESERKQTEVFLFEA